MKRFVIVGGGIVGLATAYKLLRAQPGASVTVLEKEAGPGRHQTTHNSGVLHCGLYYKPGSLKARLAVSGIREMVAFCREHGVPHEICGKLVVATDEAEVGRLKNLLERGTANGLSGLRWLDRDGLREVEPHAAGIAALHVPEEGIVDYAAVTARLVERIAALGGAVTFNARATAIRPDGGGWRIGRLPETSPPTTWSTAPGSIPTASPRSPGRRARRRSSRSGASTTSCGRGASRSSGT